MASSAADDACCKQGTPVDHPVGSATGTVIEALVPATGMRAYQTGSGRSVGIVAAYDIFGFDVEQTRMFCDELAAAVDGTVVMPDYYRGSSWTQFPIEDQEKFQRWVKEVADAEKAMGETLDSVVPYMKKTLGNDCPLAIVGFCWGGWLVAITLGHQANPFACGVGLHPSKQSAEDIAKIRAPIALFPAENDPEMADFLSGIPDKQLAAKCVHKRFMGVKHGWCTKRSSRDDPQVMAKVNEANADTAAFIKERTKQKS